MNAYGSLGPRAALALPAEIASYLRARGWTAVEQRIGWVDYAAALGGERHVIEVPLLDSTRDYPRAVGSLLDDLARIEARSPAAVYRDIKSSTIDIIRLAIESDVTRDGRIPVEAGRRVFEASRDLLLAAACSVINPRPVFLKRKPDEAMKLLDRARFGQTEVGSFVLTIECNVGINLQPIPLPGENAGAPMERRVSTRLAEALRETKAAVTASSGSIEIRPFVARTQAGVSANLCDAIAELIEATAADTVTASFSFAAQPPIKVDVPREVSFSAASAVILRAAAQGLKAGAIYPDTEVTGPVFKLESADATEGGSVVLKAYVDGKFRWVRLTVDGQAYAEAIKAHNARQPVRCIGDLAREGRFLVLTAQRGFRRLSETEYE